MANYKYVSISAGIEEYLSLTDDKGRIDRAYIKKLSNSIVRKLTFEDQVQHKIALLDVVDNKVDLPKNLHKIIQVAYKSSDDEVKVKKTQVVEWIQRTTSDCNLVVTLDCPKCHNSGSCSCGSEELIMDVDRDYLMAHPEHVYGHMKWYYRHGGLTAEGPISPYCDEFHLIKYARSTMFGADYHVRGCLNLEERLIGGSAINYVVEDGSYLRLNTRSGQILLSYLEYKVDQDGYRFIPDVEDIFEAIKFYIEEMTTYRLARKNKDKFYLELSEMARVKKENAIARSREKLRTMDFQNYWSWVENNWNKVFRYDDWQESYNAPQRDRYGQDMDRLTAL